MPFCPEADPPPGATFSRSRQGSRALAAASTNAVMRVMGARSVAAGIAEQDGPWQVAALHKRPGRGVVARRSDLAPFDLGGRAADDSVQIGPGDYADEISLAVGKGSRWGDEEVS